MVPYYLAGLFLACKILWFPAKILF